MQQDFEEIFANLLDNALKWAKSSVRVSARQIGKRMEIVVEDDGPGMSARDIEKVCEIGARLDESVPGSGFGLAIVRKRAQSRDGEVSLGASSMGGLSARLSLPVGGRSTAARQGFRVRRSSREKRKKRKKRKKNMRP